MRFVLFYHSLISDWNHGNAHFLRGVASELLARGHTVRIFEPATGWSLQHLREQSGETAVRAFQRAYPQLQSSLYDLQTLDLDSALDSADVVIVHEWNDPQLVRNIGLHRSRSGQRYRLLFHDTHHRAVSAPEELLRFDLSHYDGVLAFGEALRQIYEDRAWAARAWTWHEAADTRVFRPTDPETLQRLDLVWIGNWGEGERAAELSEFLLEPVRRLGLHARIYGVRYPAAALRALQEANIDYAGWVANFRAPAIFAQSNCTVHVPRRYYSTMLPGIPTIRMFEALACAIPLVSAPWDDCERLFNPGTDFLVARTGTEMEAHLQVVKNDPDAARELASAGYRTIQRRHTCSHRVDELLAICRELRPARASLPEAV